MIRSTIMKNVLSRTLLLCALLLSLTECMQEKEMPQPDGQALTVQQAKELYDAAMDACSTKAVSDLEKNNMFYRKDFSPDWKRALPTQTDEIESVDVPLDAKKKYYVLTAGKDGFYLTWCHHSLTVVKSRKTKQTGVYNHFFIPFSDPYREKRSHYENELYRGFHNNGFRDGFSGLELFSTVTGQVVKYNWYVDGKLRYSLFAGDGLKSQMKIRQLLKYYIHRAYSFPETLRVKTKTSYRCPECSHVLHQNEDDFYCCSDCGWNEMDFWEQTLEEAIIYGDGGGGGGGYGGGNDLPVDPNQPDPGGSGGGGSGHGGGDGSDPCVISLEEIAGFSFDDRARELILPTVLEIMTDCGGAALVSALEGHNIPFVEEKGILELIKVVPLRGTISGRYSIGRVEYNLGDVISHHKLFEELYHCYQLVTQDYSPDWKLNVEIEAKYASYLYVLHTQNEDLLNKFKQSYDFSDVFEGYRTGVTSYAELADSIRNSHAAYSNMPDHPNHRSMNGLSQIFDCYE